MSFLKGVILHRFERVVGNSRFAGTDGELNGSRQKVCSMLMGRALKVSQHELDEYIGIRHMVSYVSLKGSSGEPDASGARR